MGVRRDDPPEDRKRALMRRATTEATHKFSLTGREKVGRGSKRPITLPTTPWDDKPEDKEK